MVSLLGTSDLGLVNELESAATAAIFTAAKFWEVNPPKLSSLIGDLDLSVTRIISDEAKLLANFDYAIVPPADPTYANFLSIKLFDSPNFFCSLMNYFEAGLTGNFLRKYNPRLLVFGITKMMVINTCKQYDKPLQNMFIINQVNEAEAIKQTRQFMSNLMQFIAFAKKRNLEFLIKNSEESL